MTKHRIFSHVIERSMNSFLVLEARVFYYSYNLGQDKCKIKKTSNPISMMGKMARF